MRVQFVERENRPERLLCEAEIHLEEGELAGTAAETLKRVKTWIVEEYRKVQAHA